MQWLVMAASQTATATVKQKSKQQQSTGCINVRASRNRGHWQ